MFGLGFHPNMAITEGLAVALDPREKPLANQAAGYLVAENKLSNPKNIFSIILDKICCKILQRGGSLLGFIIDNYGLDKAISLFSGKSWDRYSKATKIALSQNGKSMSFHNMIEKLKSSTRQDFQIQRSTLRTCPHTIASLSLFSENQHFSSIEL